MFIFLVSYTLMNLLLKVTNVFVKYYAPAANKV